MGGAFAAPAVGTPCPPADMHITKLQKKPLHEIPYRAVGGGGRHLVRKRLPVLRATADNLPPSLAGLLATADLQGFDPGVGPDEDHPTQLGFTVARELHALQAQGQIPGREALGLVLAGDLYARPGKRGGLGDVSGIWRAWTVGPWVAGVLGNHDSMQNEAPRTSPRLHILDGGTAEESGLRLGGVSGVVGDPSRPNRRPHTDFLACLDAVLDQQPDLLILHQGPTPVSGRSKKGLPEVRERLQHVERELLVIFGHEHWKDPFEQLTPAVQLLNVHERVVLLAGR